MAIAMKQQYAEIVKMYSQLSGSHHLWELWQDSMSMFALSISQSVDRRFFEKREAEYMRIARKYDKKELDAFAKIFAEIVIQLEADREQDFLGDLYMRLDLGSHWHGQFFTPYNICQCMAKLQMPAAESADDVKPISVMDCACGGGALLIAAGNELCTNLREVGLNGQDYICFYAQDLSQVSAMMCYIQLSLLGFAAKIKIGDSLGNPMTEQDNGEDIWYTPIWFADVWAARRAMKGLYNALTGKIK